METFKTPKGTTLPLLDLRGKKYLQVAHRIVWFREQHEDWGIETRVEVNQDSSMGFCTIKNAEGRIISTATKFEDRKGFADFIEKSETGAIGRALALCGFGTQFCPELEEGERLADSPLEPHTKNKGGSHGPSSQPPVQPNTGTSLNPSGGDKPNDGPYRITFGKKYAGRTLEEVGVSDLKSYIAYIEKSAKEEGKPIGGKAKEFIDHAENFIATWENNDIRY